jgi:hypothetical protein
MAQKKTDQEMEILSGRAALPPALRKVSIFVSSTFTDTQQERDHLIKNVYPGLSRYAASKGMEFVPSEMRWGIRQEASDAHETSAICMAELSRCQAESFGVNYVLILGDKYGYRPFPSVIAEETFEGLKGACNADDQQLLSKFFQKDLNAEPAQYLLRPVVDKDEWWGKGGKEGVFSKLQGALRTAAQNVLDDRAQKPYWISVTHDEVLHGLLDAPASREKVLCFDRRYTGCPSTNPSYARFFDKDKEAGPLLEDLKGEVKDMCPPDAFNFQELQWEDPAGQLAWIAHFGKTVEARARRAIDEGYDTLKPMSAALSARFCARSAHIECSSCSRQPLLLAGKR